MAYHGGYGKVASAMKRKRAMNKYGSGGKNAGFNRARDFQSGGGSQKVPPNVGVPPYKAGDSTSGEPQDRKAAGMRPPMSRGRTPTNLGRPANEPTERGPTGARSPMPEYQDGGKNPVKRDAMAKASGFRSFQSIVKGNVYGMRPPKKKPKNMKPAKGRGGGYA